MKQKIKFREISNTEVAFAHYDKKFLLREQRQGVFALGYAILLYELDGLNRKFVRTIGYTKSDNHDSEQKKTLLVQGIINWDKAKEVSVKYIGDLLK